MAKITYSDSEIREILAFLNNPLPSQSELLFLSSLPSDFKFRYLPGYMEPFSPLLVRNPDLFAKLTLDERVAYFSTMGFFPEVYPLVYETDSLPRLKKFNGTRGETYIIIHPSKTVVVKPLQFEGEEQIAKKAAEIQVGPVQYKSVEGYLTEAFIPGPFFIELTGSKKSSRSMSALGNRMGIILKALHAEGIVYHDRTLTDQRYDSHLIVPEDSAAVLIDYGDAINVNNHPDNLKYEDVFNHMRTTRKYQRRFYEALKRISSKNEASRAAGNDALHQLMEEARVQLQHMSREDILCIDLQNIIGGLQYAVKRLGNHIWDPFIYEFQSIYPFEFGRSGFKIKT